MRPDLRDLVDEAARALLAHRLRATLSVIGIVVGVATVVTAIAIGQGARDAAVREIGALGVDNVFVRSIAAGRRTAERVSPAPILTRTDAETLAAAVPGVVAAAASRLWRGEAVGARGRASATLAGVTVSWSVVGRPALATGRWLMADDEHERRRVAVLGAALARALFGTIEPIGERLSIGGSWFVVIGRLGDGPSRRSTVQRLNPDEAIFVPLGAMDVSIGDGDRPDRVDEIALAFASPHAVDGATRLVPALLERRLVDPARYELVVPRALLDARLRTQRTFNAVLFAIGTLALIVSGVGIMNIMLASVTERTQEIGVRRAFGARRPDVMFQFAAEAALLCIAGGVAGVPLGWLLAGSVAMLAGWPATISAWSAVLALALAAITGLLCGVYPARVAASIDPAEALRAP